jgi:hypothetical protein
MVKKIDYTFIQYYSSYDSINKYNFKSTHYIPQCAQINPKIFLKSADSKELDNLQVTSFFFLYLYGFCTSKFNVKWFSNQSRKAKRYFLQSNFSFSITKKKILEFLFNFFFLLHKEKTSFLNSINKANKVANNLNFKSFYLIMLVPAVELISKKDYYLYNSQKFDFKGLNILFSFKITKKNSILLNNSFFNTVVNQKKSADMFRNMPLFWIFN